MFGGGAAIISDIAILATLSGALVFVLSYAYLTRGQWKRSVMGFHVMIFMTVILIVSCLATASIFFGTNWPFRDFIRAAAWGSIAAVIWWRIILLYRAQRHHDHD